MAYRDYGGYAYRNGVHEKERSDVSIRSDGDKFSTDKCKEVLSIISDDYPSGHVILGDGPVYLVLYKTHARLYYGLVEQIASIHNDDYSTLKVRRTIEFDGCKIELIYLHEESYYVYARLIQQDGIIWCGFSGYGVGAGLEECGYGFSTRSREKKLWELFEK